jgi:hypothetical protein
MPVIEHWDIDVEVSVRVRGRVDRKIALEYTTTGASKGDSAEGLPAAVAPALASALADGATIADNFRKGSRNR